MARRKRTTPEVSTITRPSTVAYSRKQKSSGPDDETVLVAEGGGEPGETVKIPQQSEAPAISDRPTQQIDPDALAAIRNSDLTQPARARGETTGMPMSDFGAPPEMPSEAPPVKGGGVVENPTHMPGPRDIPAGNPDDLAPPPGLVPRGDSRSLRRRSGDKYEFALVYRLTNAVISRVGIVGTRGVWRVVEYPTTSSASHAYAREASKFVNEGFSDYRE